MRSRLLAALALLLAGCTATPASDPASADTTWAAAALPFGEGHDHTDRSQHQASTPNFEVLGWDPLVSDTLGTTPGGHFCGDAADVDGGQRLAAVEQRAIGGFVLIDVTDSAAPKRLGEFVLRGSRVYDLAIAPDGNHVVLVTTDQVNLPALPVPEPRFLEWRSACGGVPVRMPVAAASEDVVPRPSSILLVDIKDRSAPAIVQQLPFPGAGHSAFFARIDGRDILLASSLLQGNGYYQVHELAATALGARLQHLSTYTMDSGAQATDLAKWSAHDGWIAKHPVTDQTLVYLAGGRHLAILDGTDLTQPRELARWSDWTAERAESSGHMHSVLPLPTTWDGRHFTLLGPEFGTHPGDQPSGTLWMLDTTDPTHPTPVGAWTLPHEVEWSDTYMFSNHYFTAQGTTAFVSMYHGGVWAIDLEPGAEAAAEGGHALLPSVGVFLPPNDSPKPPATTLRWAPTVQEVFAFGDDTLTLFDGSSGTYVVRFHEDQPMAAPTPWPVRAPPE